MSSSDRERPRISRLFRRTSRVIAGSPGDTQSAASSGAAASASGRASTVARTAAASTTAASAPAPAPAARQGRQSTAAAAPAEGRKSAAPAARRAVETAETRGPTIEVIRSTPLNASHHHQLQEQKARALFAKYNMVLEDSDWYHARPSTDREWIEKKTRLRVHRQCHRCQTSFGNERVCQQCTHVRCKKCPRMPSKGVNDPNKSPYTVLVDTDPKYQKPKDCSLVLTLQGKHGQELVRKHPVHRVRRSCHHCNTLFAGKAQVCESCNHTRCPKCPREPYVYFCLCL